MKYLMYAISTIRDVLVYNEHNLLNGNILNRIEKELGILEDSEHIEYTKEQFQKFHLDLLELGATLLPTSEKAIRMFGER